MIKRKGYFLKQRNFQKGQMSKGGKEGEFKNKRRNFEDDNKELIKETGWVTERYKFQMGKIQLYLLPGQRRKAIIRAVCVKSSTFLE